MSPTRATSTTGRNHALAWRIDDRNTAIRRRPSTSPTMPGAPRSTLPCHGQALARPWYRVTDTCSWADGPDTVAVPGTESRIGGQGVDYSLCGQALLLLIAK